MPYPDHDQKPEAEIIVSTFIIHLAHLLYTYIS
jgi:hypothetical protein